jgi:hypothetical protein
MIDRVTQQRPRLYYGKVDMASGFFQTAIDERSHPFTAFMTSTGLFQWCRLLMGLKGAASYFQRMMASKVLAGLLYIFVELFLDDVLVYATKDEEFLERVRIVFERFRQFNITLNPKKCYFGLAEVEFVGHVLTEIAIYRGINDFYQPSGVFLHPLYAFLRLFTPLYKSPFAKQQHKSASILIWFWLYHAQDQVIEASFQ